MCPSLQLETTKDKNVQKHKRELDTLKKDNDSLNIRIGGLESELKVRQGRKKGTTWVNGWRYKKATE